MDKSQAIEEVNEHLGYEALTMDNTSFANVSEARPVWWLDIDPRKFCNDLHILLAKYPGWIWLKIDANTFPDLETVFKIRPDKGCVDLTIAIDGPRYMRDIRGGGSGYDFRRHIQLEMRVERSEGRCAASAE